MISRRASHKLVDGRHAYCHVVIHRTEQRKDSRQRTHSVYLVRLLAHIGEFPSPDTFYELRYSSLERLHQQLRASRPRLRLPERLAVDGSDPMGADPIGGCAGRCGRWPNQPFA